MFSPLDELLWVGEDTMVAVVTVPLGPKGLDDGIAAKVIKVLHVESSNWNHNLRLKSAAVGGTIDLDQVFSRDSPQVGVPGSKIWFCGQPPSFYEIKQNPTTAAQASNGSLTPPDSKC